jgi:hypothetical protein
VEKGHRVTPKRQLAAAFAAVLAIPVFLSGCAGVSDDSIKDTLRTAVVAEVPHATDALVSLNYDGSPTSRGVNVKVYLDSGTSADVTEAVDKVLEIAWAKFPVEPVSIGVAVVDGPKNPGSEVSDVDGVELHEAAEALNIDDVGLRSLLIPKSTLVARYGPWKKASGQ